MSTHKKEIHRKAMEGVPALQILEEYRFPPASEESYDMGVEWICWQFVVCEMLRKGIDMNLDEYNPMIRAIELWGEAQARLRSMQGKDWMDEAVKRYDGTRKERTKA
jgi:hypothetical protein